jgi:hypothetical protein
LLRDTTDSAPLDTVDRCDARSPKASRLSNTHWFTRPGSPTNGESSTTRSNQRFTVTIGDQGVRAAASSTDARAAGRGENRSSQAYQGAAQTTAGARSTSPRTSTCDTASPRTSTRASALVRTCPPRVSTNARAGSAYSSSSGFMGSAMAESRALRPSISASTRVNGSAAASSIGWLSAATASGSHNSSTSFGV